VSSRPEASPVLIPYGRQCIDEADIRGVADVLRSDFLTTGPKIAEFEEAVATYSSAAYGVAVNSGTAALHCAMYALEIGLGDEVIVPPLTFAATANCVLYLGARPVFADVRPDTLLIDPNEVERQITPRTKAIITVDYAGHPCDYDTLRSITNRRGIALVSDACHSLGGAFKGRRVGSLADITCFSFHPLKHLTTGEGGMAVTDDSNLAKRMRAFRSHGISTDAITRERNGVWYYEMLALGFNYRLTDIQCALGLSQLTKQSRWLERRREIAMTYDLAFSRMPGLSPLAVLPDVTHAWHLYVVRLDGSTIRDLIFADLRRKGILVNVHYIPVHLHPYYREKLGTGPGLCPVAEKAFEGLLSLPMFPGLGKADQERVVAALSESMSAQRGE
jgi:perosamine synthetase